jgi:phosphoglycolate phosphatase-like HAD superfamily hydrolase
MRTCSNNPIVALDVDGVLGDFEKHWMRCAQETLGRTILKASDQFCLGNRYGLTSKEVDAVWRAFHGDHSSAASHWATMPLYDHAHDLVYALEDLGCQVWAVTSIDPRHESARVKSLAGLIPAKRVVCVGHDAPADEKADVLHRLGAVSFLDDQPANTNAALGVTLVSALLDRGYEGLDAPEHGVTVIDDPMDFPVLVEELFKRTGRMVA